MTEPTTYEISLRGKIGARSLRPLIDDFTIVESEPDVTRLVGLIRDSSQMHGVVAHLASMGIELLAITPTEFHDERSPVMTHQTNEQDVEAAQLYVQQLKAFYIHVGFFAVGMLVILVVNLATNRSAGIAGDWSAWWSIWAFLGWGAGIAVHGLVVRLNRPSTTAQTWEQRQLDKLLSR